MVSFASLPSLAPAAACDCTLHHSAPPLPPLIHLLVYVFFLTHAVAFVQTFLRGWGGSQRGVFFLFSHLFVPFFIIIISVCMFCGRIVQHAPIRVRFNTYLILYHWLWFPPLSSGLILV